VVAETVPAVGPDGVAEWKVEPEHFRLSFDGYILPETFHEPQIVVYPVSEFEASSEAAANTIAALRQFLAEKPATPDGIPFLLIAGRFVLCTIYARWRVTASEPLASTKLKPNCNEVVT